ncbi:putative entry exclusion protein TrbK-alt [Bradyrhizobium sp. AZCC 1708]|uniref:putative entry exclusion protein TrbK-alt n=1 Tax=Bradyrhizobium sp. AZCC 1708 TaxID=3117015 RepID=UPI003FA53411
MSRRNGIGRLLLAATAAVVPTLVVAACAIQLRGDDDSALGPSSVTQRDPVAAELDRCRTVTPEQVADIQECRRVWAENRRRFLGQRKASGAPSVDGQPSTLTSSSAQPKDPGRVLQDRPASATPKSE